MILLLIIKKTCDIYFIRHKVNKISSFFLFSYRNILHLGVFLVPNMTQVNSAANTENDDLTCPITLELFRDPVVAKDGHVYEREAITRWILQHGTSPFTREPLQINDLRPDDRLRHRAAQRGNSTVSYNARDNTVVLPPLRRVPRPTARVAPAQTPNLLHTTYRPKKCSSPLLCCCIICTIVISGIITLVVVFSKTIPRSTYTGTIDFFKQ